MAHITPDIPGFVTFILSRLKSAGHDAYVVGGALRDAFLKRPVMDWDVATSATPDHIRTLFRDQRHFALKHDTITLVHSGAHFEVTPFRGTENTLQSDLSHRDFTVNAMAFDPADPRVIDPAHGACDITKRVLRAVGNPEDRFREDPIRLLRCVRLAAELDFRIDPRTSAGLTTMAPLLSTVAPERIRDELMKILMTRRPSGSFYLMVRTGLLKAFLPELLEGYLKRQNKYHQYTIFRHIVETIDRVRPDPVLRLTALLHDIAKPRTRIKRGGTWHFYGHEKESARLAQDILKRLRFGNEMAKKVTHLTQRHMINYDPEWSNAAVRRLIRRIGIGHIRDLLAFRRADLLAHGPAKQDLILSDELDKRVKEQLRREAPTSRSDLAVDGHMVMKITGLSPGPQVGRVLRELNEKVLDHPELNTKKDLEALLETVQTSP
ncbi:MAG: CCA tRNA nucleotidyltransferase [Deltaproteobacteria bacterium]|nr:CCA tRNA nucleotidyltransferase [Deltaproteobacteria bacterium]